MVINTYNRAASLRTTLDALRHQTFTDFEVIVVNGPSDDGTEELLAARADAVRVVGMDERHLARSRNLGIDAAAGEIVAFIDDDAIPEARWLEQLAAAYDADDVGGAGGLTLDHTGVRPQYRYSLCDRIGRTDFGQVPPFTAANRPGANPFLYLQGTNCSFRRSALEAIEGFDEEIEYNYDEAEVCSRVIDSGLRLRALGDAVVHHKFLPSHMRRKEGFTDPFYAVKNRVYFACRAGSGHHSTLETVASLTAYVEEIMDWMRAAARQGDFTQEEVDAFESRASEGFALGLERGMEGRRKGRALAPADPGAFLPYPVLVPEGRRLAVAFVSQDYPPRPLGGIGRFTHDLARGFAAAGHEAHVVTRDDEHEYRIDFEEGVWVHRFPVGPRWLPDLADAPLRGNLEHAAAVHAAIARLAERVPVDVVSGSLWVAEPLLAALGGRWATSVACNTPMRKVAELQPETAAAPLTPHQIALEDALLRSPAALQPVSHENARLVATVTDKPLHVIWHGVADRCDDFPRARSDEAVEILFAGRLEPRKGIDVLLEAAAGILRDHPGARLRVLGGDNPHANGRPEVFQDWVAEHAADVAERIRFDGHVSDDELYRAYADCDVFCAPSRYESFGLVQVEAMMMSRPVVACDVGGMRETVVDGETGLLVAPGDAAALRGALERLVGDARLRERMGAAGRARYEAEFRNEVAVRRNVALYETLEPGPEQPLAGVLADLCDLAPDAAERAASTLLEPHRFPVDLERGVRDAFGGDDAAFVAGVFETVLGRPADELGLSAYLPRLAAGEDRLALVREIADSNEAKVRDLDLRFLDDLAADPPVRFADLGAAWLRDDDADFAAALVELIAPGSSPEPLVQELRRGTPRAAAARAVLRHPVLASAGVDALRSEREAIQALLAHTRGSDREFVGGAYRVLLARDADPEGLAGFVAALEGRKSRADVVRAVGGSAEGATRGFTAPVVDRIAAAVDGGRSRGAARVLRDRATGRDALERSITQARDQLQRSVEQLASAAAVARLSRETRATREAVAALQATAATGAEGGERTAHSLAALRNQVDVMARKHEAMALDLRERLPVQPGAGSAEPQVRDPEALAARVEEIGGLKVNVGCGEKPLPGYVNVDMRPLPGVDVVADAERLPFEPGSVAEIASFHLIEHFREHQAATVVLPYWRSLLSAGGVLRVVTPNWEVLIDQMREGSLAFDDFKKVTFGAQDYQGDDHFALYSPATLARLLETAGFEGVEILEDRRQNGLSPEMELVAFAGRPVAASDYPRRA